MDFVSQLHFEKPEGNLPKLKCHWCQSTTPNPEWELAELKPFENESSTVIVAVCGDGCKEKMLKHQTIEYAVGAMILSVYDEAFQRGERLKQDYHNYIQKLLDNA